MHLKLLSWNIAQRVNTWTRLIELAEEHGIDVALLQEAKLPPAQLMDRLDTWPDKTVRSAWHTWDRPDSIGRSWCSALAWFPWSRCGVNGETRVRLIDARWDQPTISHPGQFSVGRAVAEGRQVLTLVSLYGVWDKRPDRAR